MKLSIRICKILKPEFYKLQQYNPHGTILTLMTTTKTDSKIALGQLFNSHEIISFGKKHFLCFPYDKIEIPNQIDYS